MSKRQKAEDAEREVAPRVDKRSWMLLGAGAVLLAAVPVIAWVKDNAPPPTRASVLQIPALVALDDMVQKRMAVVPDDGAFGIRRMAIDEATAPITPQEKKILSQVRGAKLDVALYMGGRSAHSLGEQPGKFTTVSRPVLLTGEPVVTLTRGHQPYVSSRRASQPRPSELPAIDDLRKSIETILSSGSKIPERWQSGQWDVVAVPVIASKQACVDCHNQRLARRDLAGNTRSKQTGGALQYWEPLVLGDVAGVAVYAYRQRKTP